MCGIVGLFLRNPALEPKLGAMLAGMLGVMSDRGPDSAGFAIYGSGDGDHLKMTLRGDGEASFAGLAAALAEATGLEPAVERRDSHLVLTVPRDREAEVRAWLAAHRPDGDLQGGRPAG